MKARNLFFAIAAVWVLAPVGGAYAQTVINAAAVAAGGITPGDAPGFPATISTPGSYILTSNLTVGSAPAVTAVQITGENVSLDLNGFSVQGPLGCQVNQPSLRGVSCSTRILQGPTLPPLIDITAPMVRVHNGFVTGSQGDGIHAAWPLGVGLILEDLIVSQNGDHGIDAGNNGSTSIQNLSASMNAGGGISLSSSGSQISNVHASFNSGIGIETFSNVTLNQVVSGHNTGIGTSMATGQVSGLVTQFNGGDGFNGAAAVSFSRAAYNGGDGFAQVRLLTHSQAANNTGNGVEFGSGTGCYSDLFVNSNATPQINGGVALTGTTTTCL